MAAGAASLLPRATGRDCVSVLYSPVAPAAPGPRGRREGRPAWHLPSALPSGKQVPWAGPLRVGTLGPLPFLLAPGLACPLALPGGRWESGVPSPGLLRIPGSQEPSQAFGTSISTSSGLPSARVHPFHYLWRSPAAAPLLCEHYRGPPAPRPPSATETPLSSLLFAVTMG